MRKTLVIISILCALAATSVAQVKMAPLDIRQRTLPNGLRVVSVQDNSSPTVAIHVWYAVGGKNDPQGRSGFAHMFEHMMFKSTRNMPNEKMDRLTEDVGGFNNASTWDDFTNYYEVVPSNYLETLLWAESDRMVNLNVDEANFKSERDVVKEEFRQRILAEPYGRFFEYLTSLSYQVHPYKRGVIGNLDELDAATPSDAQQFYRTFYRPDNAYLIVVGDFDAKQFDAWVDKYFGRIAKPSGTIPRVTETEPRWSGERRYNKTAPSVPFPAVALTWLGPKSNEADLPALRVAQSIMSGGESSRLNVELIRNQKIAQNAEFSIENHVDGGLLTLYAIASEEGKPEQIEKSLLAELARMQSQPVSAAELTKAKNLLVSNAILSRETNDGRAIAIEAAIAYQGDPTAFNSDIQKLQAVTAADVQSVMKKYFGADRVVIYYQQGGGDEVKK